MATRVGLIDYGMGNLFSVSKVFERLGNPLKIVRSQKDFDFCDALILPGVGAFDPAMERLQEKKLITSIKSWSKENKPLLGICLGLQLLFDSSDEGSQKGLGIIKGHVKRLPEKTGERIPHMGWSIINSIKQCPILPLKEDPNWVYFVHSYAAITSKEEDLAATTKFGGIDITAIVWKGRVGACQFHPEKSSKTGQKMLSNWLNWLEKGAQF